MTSQPQEVSQLILRWSQGEGEALEGLMPLVIQELRQLARQHFGREPTRHTLQPTALVNEVYLRLAGQRGVQLGSRTEFFAFASGLMRRILVDHARERLAAKRGGGRPLSLDLMPEVAVWFDRNLIALDAALQDLAKADERQKRVVELRFFAGLTHEEIGEVLGVSERTVKREWRTARVFLHRQIHSPPT